MGVNILRILVFVFVFCSSAISSAAVHFTLQGTASDSDAGLQSYNKRAFSTSIAFDVGRHFRLGLTHRQEDNKTEAWTYNSNDSSYYFRSTKTFVTSNSLDLTVIIYYGSLFVPYIQGGLIVKDYEITDSIAGFSATNSIQSPPVPNAGAGLNIILNRNFSLKLSYNISPGYRVENPLDQENVKDVWDSYTSIGITYKI